MIPMNEFQKTAISANQYPNAGESLLTPVLMLAGGMARLINLINLRYPDANIPPEIRGYFEAIELSGVALAQIRTLASNPDHLNVHNIILRVPDAKEVSNADFFNGAIYDVLCSIACLAREAGSTLEGVVNSKEKGVSKP